MLTQLVFGKKVNLRSLYDEARIFEIKLAELNCPLCKEKHWHSVDGLDRRLTCSNGRASALTDSKSGQLISCEHYRIISEHILNSTPQGGDKR